MQSNQEQYNEQRVSASDLLESEVATEMLKLHHEYAKPSFALSRWLLAVTGAVAAAVLADVATTTEILGKSWFLAGIVVLILAGIVGLFAIYIEFATSARVAILTGISKFSDVVASSAEFYNKNLALYAKRLKIEHAENVVLPDSETITKWFQYPDSLCISWTYGRVDGADKGAEYSNVVASFARQACLSRVQLFLLVVLFCGALVDIGQQQFQAPATAPTKSSVPATTDQAVTVEKK